MEKDDKIGKWEVCGKMFSEGIPPDIISITEVDSSWTQEFLEYINNSKFDYIEVLDDVQYKYWTTEDRLEKEHRENKINSILNDY